MLAFHVLIFQVFALGTADGPPGIVKLPATHGIALQPGCRLHGGLVMLTGILSFICMFIGRAHALI